MRPTELSDQSKHPGQPSPKLKAKDKKLHPALPNWTLESVLVQDIIGLDKQTETFIANQDLVHRIDFNLNAWEPKFWPWLLCHTPLLLQKNSKGKYFALGSGRLLPLLRQIYPAQSSVQALVCSTRLLREQKLAILASETICALTIHRTKAGLPGGLYQLWEQLQEHEGLSILRGIGPKVFSQATGFARKSLGTLPIKLQTEPSTPCLGSLPDLAQAQVVDCAASDRPVSSVQDGTRDES